MNNKTSYQYLQEFCQIKSRSSFSRQENPITPRVQYLIDELKKLELNYDLDEFAPFENIPNEKYVNIYVKFQASDVKTKETIVFLAHHDIANPYSQNCQDNSASVCNLLELCSVIKNTEINKNVIVCFTDGEEPASIHSGAGRIGRLHQAKQSPFDNVDFAINLELTGRGKIIWMDYLNAIQQYQEPSLCIPYITEKIKPEVEVYTPFNDCYTLRYFGLDSICIGCFVENDKIQIKNREYPDTWKLCHSPSDTIDKISEEDMSYFVHQILTKLIP